MHHEKDKTQTGFSVDKYRIQTFCCCLELREYIVCFFQIVKFQQYIYLSFTNIKAGVFPVEMLYFYMI